MLSPWLNDGIASISGTCPNVIYSYMRYSYSLGTFNIYCGGESSPLSDGVLICQRDTGTKAHCIASKTNTALNVILIVNELLILITWKKP